MTDERARAAQNATDEAGSAPVAAVDERAKSPRAFLAVGIRDLDDDDLSTRAARRFLIAEIQRLDSECAEHQSIRRSNLDLQVKIAGLEASQRQSTANSRLIFICSTVGSAGIGAAPSYLSLVGGKWPGITIMVCSIVLLIASIVGKRDQDA